MSIGAGFVVRSFRMQFESFHCKTKPWTNTNEMVRLAFWILRNRVIKHFAWSVTLNSKIRSTVKWFSCSLKYSIFTCSTYSRPMTSQLTMKWADPQMSFPLDVCRSLTESICWNTTKRVGLAAYSDGASASSHNDPHLDGHCLSHLTPADVDIQCSSQPPSLECWFHHPL